MRLGVVAFLALAACEAKPPELQCPVSLPSVRPNTGNTYAGAIGHAGSCIRYTATLLSYSPEPATVVADAAVAGCAGAIDEIGPLFEKEYPEESTESPSERRRYWRGEALYTVVRARLRKCDFPSQ